MTESGIGTRAVVEWSPEMADCVIVFLCELGDLCEIKINSSPSSYPQIGRENQDTQ